MKHGMQMGKEGFGMSHGFNGHSSNGHESGHGLSHGVSDAWIAQKAHSGASRMGNRALGKHGGPNQQKAADLDMASQAAHRSGNHKKGERLASAAAKRSTFSKHITRAVRGY